MPDSTLPCLPPAELASGMTLVDVRSPEEYAAAHVDGAVNIPLDQLGARAAELSREAPVVTVCGKGGGRSDQAAALLRSLGFSSVRPLCGGTQAWLEAARARG